MRVLLVQRPGIAADRAAHPRLAVDGGLGDLLGHRDGLRLGQERAQRVGGQAREGGRERRVGAAGERRDGAEQAVALRRRDEQRRAGVAQAGAGAGRDAGGAERLGGRDLHGPRNAVQAASVLTTIGSSCGRSGAAPSAFTAPQLTSVPVAPATTVPAAASGAGVAGASAARRILITSPRAGGPRSSVAGTSKPSIADRGAVVGRPAGAPDDHLGGVEIDEEHAGHGRDDDALRDQHAGAGLDLAEDVGALDQDHGGVGAGGHGRAARGARRRRRSRSGGAQDRDQGEKGAAHHCTVPETPSGDARQHLRGGSAAAFLKRVRYGADGTREVSMQMLLKAPRTGPRRARDRVVHSATTDGRRSAEMRHEITPPRADSGLAQRPAGVAAFRSARRAGEPRKEG